MIIFKVASSIKRNIIKRIRCFEFRKHAVLGNNFACGAVAHCNNYSGTKTNIAIGDNCEIHGSLYVGESGKISIGAYTTIRFHSEVLSNDSIKIGNHVIISNNVSIMDNNNHPTDPKKRIELCESGFSSELWNIKFSDHAPIVIEDNVWIGQHSTILKGVTIGRGSIVATRAVVTHDVPEYTIVAGNPARIVKKLNV